MAAARHQPPCTGHQPRASNHAVASGMQPAAGRQRPPGRSRQPAHNPQKTANARVWGFCRGPAAAYPRQRSTDQQTGHPFSFRVKEQGPPVLHFPVCNTPWPLPFGNSAFGTPHHTTPLMKHTMHETHHRALSSGTTLLVRIAAIASKSVASPIPSSSILGFRKEKKTSNLASAR